MPTKLSAGKKSRRAGKPYRTPLRADCASLRQQAADMLHAFAGRLLHDLARQGILPPPAIELWLDTRQQFCVRDNHPDAEDIVTILETPSYYLHFKTLESLYELLESASNGPLANGCHLHIGLSSAGPLAFLCVRCNHSSSSGHARHRHQGCAASG
ncbi:hypothetical protein [Rivihabitans pingtungensis]|uniref:Uncharacterized protein n=1 Tax=Rivihabitans pingtungensis TaxID=1054498 RepID=A0A318KKM1_9NEIS|nr:hypothetical protein [Rivihabitans pingtungensis]PXX78339.1 hypothetical protein DFR34_11258 [Rivihabitans pingtungensis]